LLGAKGAGGIILVGGVVANAVAGAATGGSNASPRWRHRDSQGMAGEQ
jgi:hypothetical protein